MEIKDIVWNKILELGINYFDSDLLTKFWLRIIDENLDLSSHYIYVNLI